MDNVAGSAKVNSEVSSPKVLKSTYCLYLHVHHRPHLLPGLLFNFLISAVESTWELKNLKVQRKQTHEFFIDNIRASFLKQSSVSILPISIPSLTIVTAALQFAQILGCKWLEVYTKRVSSDSIVTEWVMYVLDSGTQSYIGTAPTLLDNDEASRQTLITIYIHVFEISEFQGTANMRSDRRSRTLIMNVQI